MMLKRARKVWVAEQLTVKQPTVAQTMSGRIRSPPAWVGPLLDMLGLEVVFQPEQQP